MDVLVALCYKNWALEYSFLVWHTEMMSLLWEIKMLFTRKPFYLLYFINKGVNNRYKSDPPAFFSQFLTLRQTHFGWKQEQTWVYVAVTHRMRCVLALPVALAEEAVSQTTCFGEASGIRGVTQVHHLVHSEECLVASLLSLSQFLRGKEIISWTWFLLLLDFNWSKTMFQAIVPSLCQPTSQNQSAAPVRPG